MTLIASRRLQGLKRKTLASFDAHGPVAFPQGANLKGSWELRQIEFELIVQAVLATRFNLARVHHPPLSRAFDR